jgi:hypothetical protein
VNGSRRTKLVDGLLKQVECVRGELASAGMPSIEVKGALCFVNGEGLPLFRKQRMNGVLIDGGRSAAKLAARPGDLSPERIEAIYRELAARLPPA